MLDIVRVGLERRDQVAAIWADAFARDPLMSWVFPNQDDRLEALTRWWEFTLDHLPPGSELHGTRIDGCVAYWQPPRRGYDHPSVDTQPEESAAQREFAALLVEFLGELAPSRMEGLRKMNEARPAEPHWYLAVLGTASNQQGRGLGGQVLAPMLARCDRMGVLACLESSNPANVGFYLRHGFVVTDTFILGEDVLITLMSRSPRTSL